MSVDRINRAVRALLRQWEIDPEVDEPKLEVYDLGDGRIRICWERLPGFMTVVRPEKEGNPPHS